MDGWMDVVCLVSPSLVCSGHGDRLLCAGLSILLHHQFSLGTKRRGVGWGLLLAVAVQRARDYFASALSPLIFVWREGGKDYAVVLRCVCSP